MPVPRFLNAQICGSPTVQVTTTPADVGFTPMSVPHSGPSIVSGRKSSRASKTSQPRVLWQVAPLTLSMPLGCPWHDELSGPYDPQRGYIRGLPYWTKRRGTGWLFSDPRGVWMFAAEQAHLERGIGWVCSGEQHQGEAPQTAVRWKVSAAPGARWRHMPEVTVKLESSASARRGMSRASRCSRRSRSASRSSRGSQRTTYSDDPSQESDGEHELSAAGAALAAVMALREGGPPLAEPAPTRSAQEEGSGEYREWWFPLGERLSNHIGKLAKVIFSGGKRPGSAEVARPSPAPTPAPAHGAATPPRRQQTMAIEEVTAKPLSAPPLPGVAARSAGCLALPVSCYAADEMRSALQKAPHFYRADYPGGTEKVEIAQWTRGLPQAWKARMAADPEPFVEADVICPGLQHRRRSQPGDVHACCALHAVYTVWGRVHSTLENALENGWLNPVRGWFGGDERAPEGEEWQEAILEMPAVDAAEGLAAVCVYTHEALDLSGAPRPAQLSLKLQEAMQKAGDRLWRQRITDQERYAHIAALEVLRPLFWRLDRFATTLFSAELVSDLPMWRSVGCALPHSQYRTGRVVHWAALCTAADGPHPEWTLAQPGSEATFFAVDCPVAMVGFATLRGGEEGLVHSHSLLQVVAKLPRSLLMGLGSPTDVIVLDYVDSTPPSEQSAEERVDQRLRALREAAPVFHTLTQMCCGAEVGAAPSEPLRHREQWVDCFVRWLRRPDPSPLLLVGGQGSGKTTALLRAAAHLAEAGEDATHLPIYLPLATMAEAATKQDGIAHAVLAMFALTGDHEATDELRQRPLVLLLDGLAECPLLCAALARFGTHGASCASGAGQRSSSRRRTTQNRRQTSRKTRTSSWQLAGQDDEPRSPLLPLSGLISERWPNTRVVVACSPLMLAGDTDGGPCLASAVAGGPAEVLYLQDLSEQSATALLRAHVLARLSPFAPVAERSAAAAGGAGDVAAADLAEAAGVPEGVAAAYAAAAARHCGPGSWHALLHSAAAPEQRWLQLLGAAWRPAGAQDAADAWLRELRGMVGASPSAAVLSRAAQHWGELPRAAAALGLLPPYGEPELCEVELRLRARRALAQHAAPPAGGGALPAGWGEEELCDAAARLAAALPTYAFPPAVVKAQLRELADLSEAEAVAVADALPLRLPIDWTATAPVAFSSRAMHDQLHARAVWLSPPAERLARAEARHPRIPEQRAAALAAAGMLRRARLPLRGERVEELLAIARRTRGLPAGDAAGAELGGPAAERKRNAAAFALSVLAASGLSLDGVDLSGVSAPGALLGGASLRCASLRRADVVSANLCGCDLRGADLSVAELRGAETELPLAVRSADAAAAVSLTPDGVEALCVGPGRCPARIVSAALGGVRKEITAGALNGKQLSGLSLSPGGRYAVAAAGSAVAVFPLLPGGSVGSPHLISEGLPGTVTCVGDGVSVLVSGGRDFVAVHRLPSGTLMRLLPRECEVACVAALPRGVCFSGAADCALRCDDAREGRGLWVATTHRAPLTAVAASGEVVASCGLDGLVALHKARNGVCAVRIASPVPMYSLGFACEDSMVVGGGGDGSLGCWAAATGTLVRRLANVHAGPVGSVSPSAHGRRVVSTGADGAVCFSSLPPPPHELPPEASRGFHGVSGAALAVSPCGGLSAASVKAAVDPDWAPIAVCDVCSGSLLYHLGRGAHRGAVLCLAFTPDGAALISGGADRRLVLHDLRTQQARELGRQHAGHVTAAAATNEVAFSGGKDRSIRAHDLRSGRQLLAVCGDHRGAVNAMCTVPGGQLRVLSAGADGSVQMHDAASGRRLMWAADSRGAVTAVAATADGTKCVSGGVDRAVRVHELASGRQLLRISRGDWVRGVTFTPCGGAVVSCGENRAVRMHSTDTGEPLWAVHGACCGPMGMAPDGRHAVAADAATGQLQLIALPAVPAPGTAVPHAWQRSLLPPAAPLMPRLHIDATGAESDGALMDAALALALRAAGANITQEQLEGAQTLDATAPE